MSTNSRVIKADLWLMLTALIWGMAFVAQRVGMDFVGPFTFNGLRFLLGAFSLIPLCYFIKPSVPEKGVKKLKLWKGGVLAGLLLFAGASFQQIGIVYTSAGNAGFITSLYVLLVPLFLLIFWKKKPDVAVWIGAVFATVGLVLLGGNENMSLQWGDLLVLISAVFWAGHVIVLGELSPRMDALRLAIGQFLVCGILSFVVAVFTEEITWSSIQAAGVAILYGGLASVGIAYTIQVFAQKNTPATHAAIVLSFESVFAAIGGWLLLDERLGFYGILGCVLMFFGVILAQLKFGKKKSKAIV